MAKALPACITDCSIRTFFPGCFAWCHTWLVSVVLRCPTNPLLGDPAPSTGLGRGTGQAPSVQARLGAILIPLGQGMNVRGAQKPPFAAPSADDRVAGQTSHRSLEANRLFAVEVTPRCLAKIGYTKPPEQHGARDMLLCQL